jgi:hypothetical protein
MTLRFAQPRQRLDFMYIDTAYGNQIAIGRIFFLSVVLFDFTAF